MVSSSTSNPPERSAAATAAAVARETSCSAFSPPPMTTTRRVMRRSSCTRGPMPVTMVCGMVPAQRAQSWMVGVAPPSGPNTVAVVPTGKDSAPVSITIWSIETRPTTGNRRPQISTPAWADELPRDPVGVPDGEDAQMGGTVGDVRAGVADRRAGLDRRRVHDRCGQTGRAVQVHGPGRIDADQSRPDADHVEVGRRVGHRPRRGREMGERRTEPRRPDRLLRLVHAQRPPARSPRGRPGRPAEAAP